MAQLVCDNGHLVSDPDALRCPECDAPARMRGTVSSPGSASSNPGPSQPTSLMVGGVVLGMLAGVILALAQGNGFGVFLAAVTLAVASTLWLIGIIAMGVRVGMADR